MRRCHPIKFPDMKGIETASLDRTDSRTRHPIKFPDMKGIETITRPAAASCP